MDHLLLSNQTDKRFVDDTEDRDNVLVLRLADELSDNPDIFERALRIRKAHRSYHKVHVRQLARVVEPVLAPWNGVQVQVDTDTILSTPPKQTQEILPADLREEGLVVPGVDNPKGDRYAHEIEARACDLGDVLLGDEGVVVVLDLLEAPRGRSVVNHSDRE